MTLPAVARSSVPMIVSIVVFPDPDGPTTATCSPFVISTLTPRRACTSPGYAFITRSSLTAAESVTASSLGVGHLKARVDAGPEICTYPAANKPVVTGIRRCGGTACASA